MMKVGDDDGYGSSASGSIAVESGKHGQGEQASRVRAGESVPHSTLTPIKTYCCATLNNNNNDNF